MYHAKQINYKLGSIIGSRCDSIAVGTNENHKTKNIVTVYPNPSKGDFALFFNDKIDNATINFYSADGLLVKRINNAVDNSRLNVDASNLASGIYFIEIKFRDKTKVIRKKIVIAK